MKDPLAGLRDIHLPPPVSWWPPAPGWWLLAALVVLATAGALWWWRRRHRAGALRRAALTELGRIHERHRQSGDDQRLVQDLSRLLRRVALSRWPRERVSGLTGRAWLAFLDQVMEDRPFEEGSGRVLAEAPYRPGVQVDAEALVALVRRWIERATAEGGHHA